MAETAPLLKDCFCSMDDAMKKIQNATKQALMSPHQRKSLTLSKNATNILHKTAKESLNEIETFKKNKCKEYKGEKVIKLKALTVATGISDCCIEIIKNQKDITDSILLTKSILKLKPNELKAKEKNHQSLEMRVKQRVINSVKKAREPYIEQQRLKMLKKSTNQKRKRIQLHHKQEENTAVCQVVDIANVPKIPCYIQIVSIEQNIGDTMDDELLKISIQLNKSPNRKATYYIYECAKRKNECLGVIKVKKKKRNYKASIDLIDLIEDSDDETDDDDDDDDDDTLNNNIKRIAVYKDKMKTIIISNCIDVILPEIEEETPNIPHSVSISSIKAIKDTDNINVYWDHAPKIIVFGTIGYKINYVNKDSKTPKRIDKLPFTIQSKDIPISIQITTMISTETTIHESNPTKTVIIDDSLMTQTQKPTKLIRQVRNNQQNKPQLNNQRTKPRLNIRSEMNHKENKPLLNTTIETRNNTFEYRASYYSGIYGSYKVRSTPQNTMYKASFSSGIYGSYLFTNFVSLQKLDKQFEINCKEKECLDLLYDHLSQNKDMKTVNKLKKWLTEKQLNSEKISRDVSNSKTSQIKLFHPKMFKTIVKLTQSKLWKTKQREIVLMSSAKLWNIVDNGVINIWSSDIVTIEIAMEYFKFFGQFRKAFYRLVEINPQDTTVQTAKKKAKNFMKNMVSKIIAISDQDKKIDVVRNKKILKELEDVANIIQEFALIQKIFSNTIDELECFAIQCIKDCIKEAPNGEKFNNAQKQREQHRQEYEKLQKLYHQKEKQLNDQYDKWIALKLKLEARKTAVEYEQKQKQNQI